nr:MarR family transcriptional regulator [Actinopolymorpha pittospori]
MDVPADKPIGYWLKHLDRLVERRFEQALAGQGLVRRHWQVLATTKRAVAQGPAVNRQVVVDALVPFWGEGAVTVEEVLVDLVRRGWIAQDADGLYSLTPTGGAAHAAVAAEVDTVRALLCEGVSEEEYAQTIRILARMAHNLAGPAVPSIRS